VQTRYLEHIRTDPKQVLARLDPDWHNDYRSSIKDNRPQKRLPEKKKGSARRRSS
jgi:hypothetical protein